MVSSCAGALLVSVFMTPLDVVKIRLQSQERLYTQKCFMYSNGIMDHLCPRINGDPPPMKLNTPEEICGCKWYNRPKYFNGTMDAIVKIARTEGVSSLWSGLSPTLVLAVPTTVIYFTTYEQLRARIGQAVLPQEKEVRDVPFWVALTAGGLARVWAVTIVSPLELVRTKMQSQKLALYEVKSALRQLVRSHGVLGLWNGYTATLLRDVPFSAIYWSIYESIKSQFGSKPASLSQTFVSGAIAGTVASTVTLPFDVIKTVKQIDMGEKDILGVKPGRSKANLDIAKEIVQKQGIRGLFSGLVPRILKVAPACAIMISSYEYCKQFFRQRNTSGGHV